MAGLDRPKTDASGCIAGAESLLNIDRGSSNAGERQEQVSTEAGEDCRRGSQNAGRAAQDSAAIQDSASTEKKEAIERKGAQCESQTGK